MKPLIIYEEAEAEFEAAVAFYEAQHSGLGLAFETTVRSAFERIQQQPDLYPFYKHTSLRKHLTERFPYAIYYREFDEHLAIIAVAHGHRRPGYWLKRDE